MSIRLPSWRKAGFTLLVAATRQGGARRLAAASPPPPVRSLGRGATALRAYIAENAVTHLDIGSREGGSTRWISTFLGARGVADVVAAGIDIDPQNVATCARRGARCVLGDVRVLGGAGERPCVRGVTLFHVLEHVGARRDPNATAPGPDAWWSRTYAATPRGAHELPVLDDQAQSEAGAFDLRDASAAARVFRAALRLPSSWLLMRGPCFDGEAELRSFGFVRAFGAWLPGSESNLTTNVSFRRIRGVSWSPR